MHFLYRLLLHTELAFGYGYSNHAFVKNKYFHFFHLSFFITQIHYTQG